MRAQINLVNPALLPPKPFFQFASMMVALGVLAAGLILLSLFMRSGLSSYAAAADQEQARLAAKQAQLQQQEQKLSQRQRDPQLAISLAAQRDEHTALQRVDQALQAGGLDGRARAAHAYFDALARQSLSEAWLTSIRIRGEHVSLQGMALRPAAVPAALELLNRLPEFKGQRFTGFELGRVPLAAKEGVRPVEVLAFRLEAGQEEGAGR